MHARRFACFVLGIWLGGGLLVAWLTSVNLKVADRLESRAAPTARLELKAMGPHAAALRRYEAAEENREYYRVWETAQMIGGCAFFALMLFGSRESKTLLCGILLLILLVALERLVISPAVLGQGRLLDFAEPGTNPGEGNRYWVLLMGYRVAEGVKWLLTAGLAGRLVFSRKGSGRTRDSRRRTEQVGQGAYSRASW
jgi:hypothetical protein